MAAESGGLASVSVGDFVARSAGYHLMLNTLTFVGSEVVISPEEDRRLAAPRPAASSITAFRQTRSLRLGTSAIDVVRRVRSFPRSFLGSVIFLTNIIQVTGFRIARRMMIPQRPIPNASSASPVFLEAF